MGYDEEAVAKRGEVANGVDEDFSEVAEFVWMVGPFGEGEVAGLVRASEHGVKGDGFGAEGFELGVGEGFEDFVELVFFPVSVSFFVDFGFLPAVGDEEVFIESEAVGGGEDENAAGFEGLLDAEEEGGEGGGVEVFEDFGEEDGVEMLVGKGEVGVVVEVVVDDADAGLGDFRDSVGFEVDGIDLPTGFLR